MGARRWLLFSGVLIGFGFLTKMLQAFIIVPPFFLVYLIAAPTSLRRRVGQLVATGFAILLSAGWWVAAIVLIPASARPYVGGSQDNNILNLIFGYNGFGRITGNETGSVGGAPVNGGGRWGATGLLRLFESEMGGQISWLLPAALLAIGALLWLTWGKPRTDRVRAAALLWGGWLLVTGVVFSYAAGIIHPYYTVALSPAVGALVGIGAVSLWQRRDSLIARVLLAVGVAGTAAWAYVLLDRSPNWYPALRLGIVVAGFGAALVLLAINRIPRQATVAIAAVALIAILAGPTAYAAQTVSVPHTGAIPSAGPTTGFGGQGRPGGFRGGPPNGNQCVWRQGGGNFPGRGSFGGFPGAANGETTAFGGFPGTSNNRGTVTGSQTGRGFPGGRTGTFRPGGNTGGMGGLLNASQPDAQLVTLLQQNADKYTWVAAMVGANNAAGIQLSTGDPVMAIGGFNGTDPTPTLAQFEQYVSEGKVHYFIASGGFGGPGDSSGTSQQIANWVEQHYTSQTVGNMTVYDLTQPANGS